MPFFNTITYNFTALQNGDIDRVQGRIEFQAVYDSWGFVHSFVMARISVQEIPVSPPGSVR